MAALMPVNERWHGDVARMTGASSGIAGLGALFAEAANLLRASPRLRRSLAFWLATGWLLSSGFTLALALLHDHRLGAAMSLLIGNTLAWLLISVFFVGGAPLLRTPDGIRIDVYGIPNGLSAIRAWSCFPLLTAAALSLPGRSGLYIWCVVGGTAGMLDFVDGWIARRFGPVTALGKAIDPAMDAIFFAMAAVGNWLLGIAPGWLAVGIVVRYLGPFMATPLVFLLGRRPELVHTKWGRRNTAAIGLVLFILMIVKLAGGPVELVALIVSIPLLVPTLLLHLIALVKRTAEAPLASPSARP